MRVRPVVLLLAVALAMAGCGDAADEADQADQPVAEDAVTPAPEETAGDADADDLQGATVTDDTHGVTVEGDLDSKPEIALPGGQPPTELVVVDLVEGDGEEVPAGATVTTHYAGVSWINDGEEFDASWNRGQPLQFPLSGVIQGWTQGIPGMRVGGRRLLIIPPEMGYGSSSPTPAIAADDTLVFVIDLVDFT